MSAVDPLSLVLGQISFAVSDLNKKNYKTTAAEIHEVLVMNFLLVGVDNGHGEYAFFVTQTNSIESAMNN